VSKQTPTLPETTVTSDRRIFQMKSCLGRGGFGEVYRATMSSAGGVRMEVAVKVLHAEADPQSQAVQRLRDEARLLGALRHPSVLAVHGLVMLDGRVAMVMEFVEGADLDKCLRGDDPIPRRGLVEMVGCVAEALDAAWRAPSPDGSGPLRLVHRDIKPANIRLGKHGEVKLLDFGIARAGNLEREAHTETNAMLGSYLYMAPERFLDGNDHGPAIDVFALGCTLFECLAGKRLFGELGLKEVYLLILDAQKYERFVQERLDLLPPDLESEIVALLYRMVALSPRERPGHTELSRTCADLADRMSGRSLDRWARSRVWPQPKQVRGVLDGVSVTESQFSASGVQVVPTETGFTPVGGERVPGAVSGAVSRRRLRDPNAGDTFEGVLSRTVSATLERPSVVVGMGFGVLGLGAVAAAVAVFLAVVGFGAGQWFAARPAAGLAPITTAAAPVAPLVPEPPAPGSSAGSTTATPRPRQPAPSTRPQPSVEPAPPTPAAATPEAPAPAPVVVVVNPVPVSPVPVSPGPVSPGPAPRPEPAEVQNATVKVEGASVLVEFRSASLTTRSRSLPPGQYDVVAYFGGRPTLVANSTNFLSAGTTYRLACSELKQTCTWAK